MIRNECDQRSLSPFEVLSSTVVLNISVADVNDWVPQFPSDSLDFFVEENAPPGIVFGILSTIDRDLAENGTVRYRMIADTDQVALDPVLGYLLVSE